MVGFWIVGVLNPMSDGVNILAPDFTSLLMTIVIVWVVTNSDFVVALDGT
jgi:hypothetical protein